MPTGVYARSAVQLAAMQRSRTKHGNAVRAHKTRAYSSWSNMHARCRNPKATQYQNYGGRGITVCNRWAIFAFFLEDMGERPDGLTLERIDNNGNYEPSNCRWATRKEQAANQTHCPTCTCRETR